MTWRILPTRRRTVKTMSTDRKEQPMTPAPSSYRDSHLGTAKARSYDEDLWDLRAAKGLDWLVEQRLLAGILRSGRSQRHVRWLTLPVARDASWNSWVVIF